DGFRARPPTPRGRPKTSFSSSWRDGAASLDKLGGAARRRGARDQAVPPRAAPARRTSPRSGRRRLGYEVRPTRRPPGPEQAGAHTPHRQPVPNGEADWKWATVHQSWTTVKVQESVSAGPEYSIQAAVFDR